MFIVLSWFSLGDWTIPDFFINLSGCIVHGWSFLLLSYLTEEICNVGVLQSPILVAWTRERMLLILGWRLVAEETAAAPTEAEAFPVLPIATSWISNMINAWLTMSCFSCLAPLPSSSREPYFRRQDVVPLQPTNGPHCSGTKSKWTKRTQKNHRVFTAC